jgi:uncharacterized protein YndB with AHSA1/START domain
MSRRIQVSQCVAAPLERIWQACAHPAGIAAWQADEVQGRVAPGERLLLRWPALGASIQLGVAQLEPGRRLTLEAGGSRVDFILEPGRVTLTQEGLVSCAEAEGTASAWKLSLGLLAHYLEHHDGEARQVRWLVQHVRCSVAAIQPFFTDGAGLRAWLTQAGQIEAENNPVRLDFAWGEHLSGTVLARTTRCEVAISWPEQSQSALVLRSLPSPRSDRERLVAVAWSRWGSRLPPAPATAEGLTRALTRLASLLSQS